uniref:Uncharacterized protein n=1 Tax=Arion vulgaris TaxID=1028688 RepID=A0A0B7B272_9EUPU
MRFINGICYNKLLIVSLHETLSDFYAQQQRPHFQISKLKSCTSNRFSFSRLQMAACFMGFS